MQSIGAITYDYFPPRRSFFPERIHSQRIILTIGTSRELHRIRTSFEFFGHIDFHIDTHVFGVLRLDVLSSFSPSAASTGQYTIMVQFINIFLRIINYPLAGVSFHKERLQRLMKRLKNHYILSSV